MSRASHPHRDLAEYGSLVGRHRMLAIGSILAGALVGFCAYVITPATYTATAQVLVTPTGVPEVTNQTGPRQRESLNLDTEAQIAQSTVVTAKAARAAGIDDIEAMRHDIVISVPPNSAILSISFQAGTATGAATGAQAVANAYLTNRADVARQALTAQQKLLTAALDHANKDLGDVTATLPTLLKGSSQRLLAAQRQTVLGKQISDLTARYDDLTTVAITPGLVISAARPPATPSAPVLPVFVGSGLFLGLANGTACAVAADRRVRDGATGRRAPRAAHA
jgi:uncharacterized protein involved in exopolysaccharide biosynthesis